MSQSFARRAPFLIVAVVVLAAAAFYRPQSYGIWADQMTYYLQANSLAYDGDLQFDRRDLERFRGHGWLDKTPRDPANPARGPIGLFLREAKGRFYYSKPFLYSLAAVPFVWVAPVRGLILLNALLWLALFGITFRWFRRFNTSGRAATLAALAWVGSAAPFYIFVIHTDLMIPTLLAMALYLWLTWEAGDERREAGTSLRRIALAGVFFGLAMYEKNPLVFFLAAAMGSLLWRRKWRPAGVLLAAAIVACALPTAVHVAQDGHLSPYQGRRVYCDGNFPFDDLDKARTELAGHRHPGGEFFDPQIGRTLLGAENLRSFAAQLPMKLGYYFVGRKTGLFPYLTPALAALVLWLVLRQWRGEGRPSLWIALGLAAYALFYFLTLSAYYGGATAIGNRYALQALPAFLLMVRRFPETRARFRCTVAALAGAALFFPGYDLLTPYGKVRDNLDLFQKSRFRWLPFEWHLAWFMSDKDSAVVGLGELGKLLRLTDLNPTYSDNAYFVPSKRHEVALLSRIPFPKFPVALAARSQPLSGWVESGRHRRTFDLAPYETRQVRLPLSLRRRAYYRSLGVVYCYSIDIITTSPLEPNTIFPKDYYQELGPFVRWFADERATSPTASVAPDNPSDGGRLLWGWQAPEKPGPDGMRLRWAGEATESAIVLRAEEKREYTLRVTAQCPVTVETDVLWNGRSVGKRVIRPDQGNYSQTIEAADVRDGENVLRLRHARLWQPRVVHGAIAGNDERWLAVHCLRIALEPSTAAIPRRAP